MKKIIESLIAFIPFLSPYPFWVKWIIVIWIIGLAIIIGILIFTYPNKVDKSAIKNDPFVKSSKVNYPELVMVVKQDGFYSEKIKILKRSDGNYEAFFRLAIKNNGNQALKANEGYWHIYFPNAKGITMFKGSDKFIAKGESNHLRDLINLPIYSKSFLDFGPEYRFLVKKDRTEKVSVRYFFETDYGYFPESIKLHQKTGAVAFADMGVIELEWPKD